MEHIDASIRLNQIAVSLPNSPLRANGRSKLSRRCVPGIAHAVLTARTLSAGRSASLWALHYVGGLPWLATMLITKARFGRG